MVVFLSLCWCGDVFVVVFLWWCSCGGVFVVVFLWCGCGGVLVVVFLWRCFCGGVLVVVFLWRCAKYYSSTTKYYSVLQSTTPCTTPCYSSTTPYYKVLLSVLLQYYSVLQSTTPVLLRTTKYYSSTTPYYKVLLQYYSNTTLYYKVLLQYYSVLQSTTPTSETTSERRPSSTTPYYASTTKASKTSISCEASATFHRKSFQNDRFVRGFLQISQNKLPKRTFRAMLPTNFTEQASKTSVSHDASDNFHRKSFQKDRFARCFLQISQNKLPKRAFCVMLPPNFTKRASKMIVSCEASSKFHRTMLPKRAFRAMLPTIFTKNLRFATVSRNRHTDSYERVHPQKAKCASHYNAVHSQM